MLIYLYGRDGISARQKIREIIKEYKKKYPHSLNTFRFNEENFIEEKLEDCVKNKPLFEAATLIVLENIYFLKNPNFINPETIWIIYQEKLEPRFFKIADRKQEFKMLEKKPNYLVFKAIDKLAEGDKKTALKLFQQLIAQGENEIYLFSMVVYKWRTLIKSKRSRKFSLNELKLQFKLLADLDLQIKTGQKEAGLALDFFILKI